MSGKTCPGDEELRNFAFGRIPRDAIDDIAAHLETCGKCSFRIEQIEQIESSEDELLGRLQRPDGPVALDHDGPTDPRRSSDTPQRAMESTLDFYATDLNSDRVAGPNSIQDDRRSAAYSDLPVKRIDDYELIQKIAHGGMGVVYRAWDVGLKCDVALKMIRSGEFAGREEIDRFHREAEAAAKLHHPGIVSIHRVGEADGLHYFTMDFVEGQSLSALIAKQAMPLGEAVRFAIEICEAVEYAHQHGVLHRDIKPSNVLVDESGRAQVTDFGLAKRMGEDSDLSQTGQALGTPGYMPPEQAIGRKGDVDYRSDVYSIGALLYHLLTGRPPFTGDSPLEVITKAINSDPVQPRTLSPKIPGDLNTICMKCLEREPSRRYASAAELRDDLGRFKNGFPIKARRVTSAERFLRLCSRNRLITSLSVATFLVLIVGAVVAVTQHHQNLRIEQQGIDQQLKAAANALDDHLERAEAMAQISHDALIPRMISMDADQLTKALGNYEALRSKWAVSHRKEVADSDLQRDTADALFRVAQVSRLTGNFEHSEASFRAAINKFEQLQADLPDDPDLLVHWGEALDYLGELYRDFDRGATAESSYLESINVLKRCGSRFTTCQEAQLELARTYNNYGLLFQQSCSNENADQKSRAYFFEAQSILKRLVQQYPDDRDYRQDLGRTLINVGRLQRTDRKYEDAQASYQQAIAEFDALLEIKPKDARYNFLSATAKMNLGFLLAQNIHDLDAAERWLLEAREQFAELPTDTIPEYRFNLAKCLTNLVLVYGSRYATANDGSNGHLKIAEEYCVKAHAELSELYRAYPRVAEFASWTGTIHGNFAAIADAKGDYETFVLQMNEAIKHQTEALSQSPQNCEYPARLRNHHEFFAQRILQSYLTEDKETRKELALKHLLEAIDAGFSDNFEGNTMYDPVRDDRRFRAATRPRGQDVD